MEKIEKTKEQKEYESNQEKTGHWQIYQLFVLNNATGIVMNMKDIVTVENKFYTELQ